MSQFREDLLAAGPPADITVPRKKNMMCLNESTLDPFKAIDEAFFQNLQHVNLNRYFNDVTSELKTELLNYIGNDVGRDQILWGNGADDMLYAVFLSVRENNDAYALSLAPSYFDYSTYSRAVGLGIKFQDFNADFSFDENLFIEALKDKDCRLGILCNPNNPTGHLLPDEKILKVIESTDKPILVDETYFEFSGKTFIDRVKDFDNLIIVRSFSKSFSAAGLRFGYLVSQAQNVEEIKKVQTIFNCSILIQTFVLTMLQNKHAFLAHTNNVLKLKNKLFEQMSEIEEITVYNSSTNFLTFTVGEKSAQLFEFLKNNEIAIRDVGAHKVLNNHLRVSVGSKEQNDFFVEKIKEFLKG